jgi:hypothetical protein
MSCITQEQILNGYVSFVHSVLRSYTTSQYKIHPLFDLRGFNSLVFLIALLS